MRLNLGLHLLYVLLFEISIAAALWQKGDPLLTVAALLGFPAVAMTARLPFRIFPKIMRQVVQILLAGGAIAWGYYRYNSVPPDLALVEATVLLGFALSVSGALEEYNLLATITLIMAGYGGLSPNRQIYLPALILYATTGLLLLYQTRTLRLLGTGANTAVMPRYRGNWGYRLLHLILLIGLFVTFVMTFPFPYMQSVGIVPVSFDTHQELQFPKLWKNWLAESRKVLVSKEGDQTTESGLEAPTVESQNAEQVVEADEENLDAREGFGGGGIGNDLVFRVHSPEKLYWLVQLYDNYDGDNWTKSAVLKQARSPLDRPDYRSSQSITQFYSIEKAVSRWLPAAFYVQHYVWQTAADEQNALQGRQHFNVIRREAIGLAQVLGAKPPLPWEYRVTSLISSGESEKFAAIIPCEISPKEQQMYYLTLRKGLISERVKRMTERLVQNADTPLAKAEALRNHLRHNYKYTLTPPPVPADAETVDYFLFESREGYCQHFAAALTVMARLAGLPSRVATGFAPGHYNLLTGYFEVHEYHAHAWSQIFVEPYGWLTLDGVAPGALPMNSKPGFVSSMIDPFGEKWDARPAELNVSPPPQRAPDVVSETDPEKGQERSGRLAEAYNRIYQEAASKSSDYTPSTKEIAVAAINEMKNWLVAFWARLKVALMNWSRNFLQKATQAVFFIKEFVQSLTYLHAVAALLFFIALLVILKEQHALYALYRKWRVQQRCRKLWKALLEKQHEPWTAVKLCHDLVDELLFLAQFERPGNMDLLEYADWLQQREPEVAGDLQVISSVFTRQHFGGGRATGQEAQTAMQSTARLRDLLLLRRMAHKT